MSKIYYRIIFLSLFLGLLACNKKKVEVEQKQEVPKAQGLYYQNGVSIGDFQITNEIPVINEMPDWKEFVKQIIFSSNVDFPNALPLDENQKMVFVYSFKMFMKILVDEEASKKTKDINFSYLQNKSSILYTKKDGTEVSFEQAFNSVNTAGKKKSYFENLWNIAKEMGVEDELLNIKDWKYEKIDKSEFFIGNELYYLKDGEKKQVTEQAYRALLSMLIISFHKNSTMEFQGGDFLSLGQTPGFDPAALFLYMPIALLTSGIDHEKSITLQEYNQIMNNIPEIIHFIDQLQEVAIIGILDYFVELEIEDDSTGKKESFFTWINKNLQSHIDNLQSYIDAAYTGINAMELNFKPNNLMDFSVNPLEFKNLKTDFITFSGEPTFTVEPIKDKKISLFFDIETMDPDHLDLKFQELFGSWADLMSVLPFKSRNVSKNKYVDFYLGEEISEVVLVKMLLESKSIDYFLKTFNISIFGMNSTEDILRYLKERYPIRLKLQRKQV